MNRLLSSLLLAVSSLLFNAAFAASPPFAVFYLPTESGYQGFWGHNNDYVEYSLVGGKVQPKEINRVMLTERLALMLNFAYKKDFDAGRTDLATYRKLLEAHKKWEIEYMRTNYSKVEDKSRDDLSARDDVMVTELIVTERNGQELKAYLVGVAANDGVFVFSISPVAPEDEPMIKLFIGSIRAEHNKPLPRPPQKNTSLQNEGPKQDFPAIVNPLGIR